MTRPTVVWTALAVEQLTTIWLACEDRKLITQTVAEIDVMLSRWPHEHGFSLHEGLCFLEHGCLRVLYAVSEPDLVAQVASVRLKP